MRTNAASDAGEELMRQSVSLLISNQTRALNRGKSSRKVGMMASIHAALSPPSFGRRHLSDDDRLSLGGKEWVDVLEDLLEGLPAGRSSNPSCSRRPRSNRRSRRRGSSPWSWSLPFVDIGHVRAPRPDDVGRASGHENIVDVAVRGDVKRRVVPAPTPRRRSSRRRNRERTSGRGRKIRWRAPGSWRRDCRSRCC